MNHKSTYYAIMMLVNIAYACVCTLDVLNKHSKQIYREERHVQIVCNLFFTTSELRSVDKLQSSKSSVRRPQKRIKICLVLNNRWPFMELI